MEKLVFHTVFSMNHFSLFSTVNITELHSSVLINFILPPKTYMCNPKGLENPGKKMMGGFGIMMGESL